LHDHATDPDLAILHVGFNRRDFARSHIPGARFIWYESIAPSNPDASTEVPDPSSLNALLEGAGVSDRSRIVITYSERNLTLAARALWTLELHGLAGRVSILDGGNDAWKAAGHAFTDAPTSAAPGTLTLSLDRSRLATAESILGHLHDASISLLDARLRTQYDGNPDQFRSGHIPGAKSLPSASLIDSLGRLKTPELLREQFGGSEIDTTKPIVAYCGVGQSASVSYLAARRLGFRVSLYDGSFQDWNLLGPEYPIVEPTHPVKH
jgi:thiosulfate/3-mercaptopyruvate sulfurtransferase